MMGLGVGFSQLAITGCHSLSSFHLPLSIISLGEGNGTPLQYSCLETPMDGGAWWAAVYGVSQSRTRLKQLSSSSSSSIISLPQILQ